MPDSLNGAGSVRELPGEDTDDSKKRAAYLPMIKGIHSKNVMALPPLCVR